MRFLWAPLCAIVACAADTRPSPEQWRLVPDLRIGVVDGDVGYTLSTVTGLLVGRNGAMYVLQRQEHLIRVFDRSGRFVRNIGRPGDGPGEFRGITFAGWRADTLWVSDGRLRRVSLFDANGKLLSTLPLASPAIPGHTPTPPACFFNDGTALVVPGGNLAAYEERRTSGVPILRIDRAGDIIDTLLVHSIRHTTLVLGESEPFWRANRHQPFSDDPLWTCSQLGDGLFVVDRTAATDARNASFRIRKYSISGQVLLSQQYRYQPKPLSRTAVDSAVAAVARTVVSHTGSERKARGLVRDVIYAPRYQSPVRGIVSGLDGSVWLLREVTANSSSWDVIDARGNILATARGRRMGVLAADHQYVWGVEADELGTAYIVRCKVVRD